MFSSGHDCTSTSSASPYYVRLLSNVAIWVLRKVREDTMLTRTRFHFCSRLRRTGSVSISRLQFPAGSRCTSSCLSFLFVCLVSVGPCSGFLRNCSLGLPFLSIAGFSVYLMTSNLESCDENDDEVGVGVVQELVDEPGTTNGKKVRCISIHFLAKWGELWFLTADPMASVPMILTEHSERKNCWSFFKKRNRHE